MPSYTSFPYQNIDFHFLAFAPDEMARKTKSREASSCVSHTWMSHVTRMNESCYTYEWVMSHIWMSHVTHMNDISHIWVMSHAWMRHVTQRTESISSWDGARNTASMKWREKKNTFNASSCVVHRWLSRVTQIIESCHVYKWVIGRPV